MTLPLDRKNPRTMSADSGIDPVQRLNRPPYPLNSALPLSYDLLLYCISKLIQEQEVNSPAVDNSSTSVVITGIRNRRRGSAPGRVRLAGPAPMSRRRLVLRCAAVLLVQVVQHWHVRVGLLRVRLQFEVPFTGTFSLAAQRSGPCATGNARRTPLALALATCR
jgi:hypothetical protein